MKRIFVTGGTGFLGSHFLAQALAAGHEVFALRRAGRRPQIPLPAEPHWLEGSLTDDWSGPLATCDALVHLAAVGVSPQKATWPELFQVNVLDSLHLWQAAVAAGVRRFLICGSCFEYGSSGARYAFIPADAPLLPTTGYGASKAASSTTALGLAAEQKLQALILRPFHMYGEGQHESNFWPALKKAALAGEDFPMTPGEQIRDFMAVEDAAAAFLASLHRTDLHPGQPLVENIGSGRPQTLRDFATTWWAHWQATGQLRIGDIPYRPGEVMSYVPLLKTL